MLKNTLVYNCYLEVSFKISKKQLKGVFLWNRKELNLRMGQLITLTIKKVTFSKDHLENKG